MQLLLSHEQNGSSIFSLVQLRIDSGVTSILHATLELDSEEEALLRRYNLTKDSLVISDPIDDIKQSFRPALLVGIVAFILFYILMPIGAAFFLAVVVTPVMTGVYFKTLREQTEQAVSLSHEPADRKRWSA